MVLRCDVVSVTETVSWRRRTDRGVLPTLNRFIENTYDYPSAQMVGMVCVEGGVSTRLQLLGIANSFAPVLSQGTPHDLR
jgi:hypothetical protein